MVNALSVTNFSHIACQSTDTFCRALALPAYAGSLFIVLYVATLTFCVGGFVRVESGDVSRRIFRALLYGSRYFSLVFNGPVRGDFQ